MTSASRNLFTLSLRLFLCISWTLGSSIFDNSMDFTINVVKFISGDRYTRIESFSATDAAFGARLTDPSQEIVACGYMLDRSVEHACSDVYPLAIHTPTYNVCTAVEPHAKKFAFVKRDDCNFTTKAYYVQKANYSGMIVMSNEVLATMQSDSTDPYRKQINISSFMMDAYDAKTIISTLTPEKRYLIVIKKNEGIPWYRYLIPFIVILAICTLVMFLFMTVRAVRRRRRQARRRLSKRNLKKIPTRKFKKGETVDTCAICLDDYLEGDKLRVLPCKHAYHATCIDPWLTRNRKVCPICKRKVLPSRGGGSSSDEEESTPPDTHQPTPNVTNDRAPLIDDQDDGFEVGNSTFYMHAPAEAPPESSPSISPIPESPPLTGPFYKQWIQRMRRSLHREDPVNPSDFRQNQPGFVASSGGRGPVRPFAATGPVAAPDARDAATSPGYYDNPGYEPGVSPVLEIDDGDMETSGRPGPSNARRKRRAATRAGHQEQPAAAHKTPIQEILSPSEDDEPMVAVPGPLHGTLLPQQAQAMRKGPPGGHGRRTRRRAYPKGSVVPCSAPASLPNEQHRKRRRSSQTPTGQQGLSAGEPADGNLSYEVTTEPDSDDADAATAARISSDDEILTMDHSISLDRGGRQAHRIV